MVTTEQRELKEIFVGGLQLLTTPKNIIGLKVRRKKDKRLDSILRQFNDPKKREKMFQYAWHTLDAQFEHRIKMGSAPYIAVYGDRGMGKSSVVLTLMERLNKSFILNAGLKTVYGFGRNPSDINDILKNATKAGKVVIVNGDESEDEVGLGKNTEEQALLDNLETIRLLRHSVFRCANRYRKLKVFSYYCDIVLEVIYQDRKNMVNYCILYIVDEEIGGSDPRVPIAIIDVPVKFDSALWKIYAELKEKEQVEFTSRGGRRSKVKKKLLPSVDALVQHCEDKGYKIGRGSDIKKPDDLMPKLIFHVHEGDKWNQGEQKLICQEAFDRLKEFQKGYVDDEADDLFKDYIWESDFEWRAKIAAMIEVHPDFKKYYLYYLASDVEGLSHNKDAEKFTEITGTKKTANYGWIKRMRNDQAFQGWLKDRRAVLHESYLVQRFKDKGWQVEAKPRFEYEGLQYEEDLLIAKDGREVWINAKCGSGPRTYVAEEYKTTYILSNSIKKETYIVYLDLERNKHEVHLPTERFAVGSGKNTAEIAEAPEPSTPFLLLRAVDGGGGVVEG